MTAQQAFDLALQLHQTGRMAEAEALYRQVLLVQPNSALVHVNLAGVLATLGRYDEAIASARRAVEIAVRLARDVPRLGELRGSLRERMEQSVLMDGAHFARQIEEAYRAMWRDWCVG